MSARVVEEFDQTVTIAVRERDYTHLDGELLIVLSKVEAEDLMHALEGWKDER